MDGRDAFLTLARDKHYEFSSLRRAQFSTMCMLYELHNQGQDKFVYTCNNCNNHVETRYHCTICDVSLLIYCAAIFFTYCLKSLLFPCLGLRSVPIMQRQNRPSTQNGTSWFRFRRWLIANRRTSTVKSTRGKKTIHTAMHSVIGACLPMSRCKLSSTVMSEDETCRDTHEKLQEKNPWWMSDMQAAYCSLLLSCEAL